MGHFHCSGDFGPRGLPTNGYSYILLAIRRLVPFVGPVISLVPDSLTLAVPTGEVDRYRAHAGADLVEELPNDGTWAYFPAGGPHKDHIPYRPPPVLRRAHYDAIRATAIGAPPILTVGENRYRGDGGIPWDCRAGAVIDHFDELRRTPPPPRGPPIRST